MTRVTVADVRAAGYCINYGARAFCQRHGLDFRRFVREGLPVCELETINDAQLARVIEVAHGRQEKADGRL